MDPEPPGPLALGHEFSLHLQMLFRWMSPWLPAVMFRVASSSKASSASASDFSGGVFAEAARLWSAAEALGSYEAHFAACNRKFYKRGFQRSWDFGLKPAVTPFAGVVCAHGPCYL